jgi:hypothetical protein
MNDRRDFKTAFFSGIRRRTSKGPAPRINFEELTPINTLWSSEAAAASQVHGCVQGATPLDLRVS